MFVAGLDPCLTQSQLISFFKKFGKIVKAKIIGEAKGRSRGFGFVHFASKRVRARVCSLQNLEIGGREIDCKVANSDREDPLVQEEDDPVRIKKVFIKEVPLSIKKSQIEEHYSKFGEIQETLLIVRPVKNTAFCYVRYFDHKDALRAVKRPQEIRPGVFLNGVLALPNNSERLQELRRNYARYAYHIDCKWKRKSDADVISQILFEKSEKNFKCFDFI